MKQRTFIPQSHMPPSLPIHTTLIGLLLCDYFNVPQWVWTLAIVFLVALWIGCIHDIANAQGRRIPGFGRKDGE